MLPLIALAVIGFVALLCWISRYVDLWELIKLLVGMALAAILACFIKDEKTRDRLSERFSNRNY